MDGPDVKPEFQLPDCIGAASWSCDVLSWREKRRGWRFLEALRMWSSLPREEIGHVISGVKAFFLNLRKED